VTAARPARPLHPGAWWTWATALAVGASRTNNPVLLLLVVAVSALVVVSRRPATPWAASYAVFVRIGLIAIVIRVAVFALLGTGPGTHVLVRLPQVPLPHWLAGVRIGGPVSLDGVLAAAYDGLRLAVILVCIGAANSLTSPRRLLKSLPGALQEVGVAVSVGLAFAPQAVASIGRLRAARRLRGREARGVRSLRGLAVPVLEGALDRSVDLAAAMDARGFGRRGHTSVAARRMTAGLTIGGGLLLLASSYTLLVPAAPRVLGAPLLAAGVVGVGAGFVLGSRRGARTRYRPDHWQAAEWLVAGSGLLAAACLLLTPYVDLTAPTSPPGLPHVPLVAFAALLVAALPAWAAPPLPRAQPRATGARPQPRTAS
jgi:energy-coupling factor transport system permease protein